MNTSISSGCVRLRLLFIFGDLWNRGYLRTYSMYVRMVSTYVCYDTYTISLHLTYRYRASRFSVWFLKSNGQKTKWKQIVICTKEVKMAIRQSTNRGPVRFEMTGMDRFSIEKIRKTDFDVSQINNGRCRFWRDRLVWMSTVALVLLGMYVYIYIYIYVRMIGTYVHNACPKTSISSNYLFI